jgi:hypothetical protein
VQPECLSGLWYVSIIAMPYGKITVQNANFRLSLKAAQGDDTTNKKTAQEPV